MKKKKERMIVFHLFFCFFVFIGVTIMYNNSHYGEGIHWITQERYEDSPAFVHQFKTDIEEIFNYVRYKEIFETGGKPDFSKPIVRVVEGPGTIKEYTVDEMVRRAKSLGYYLNKQFRVSGPRPANGNEDMQVRVDYRAYEPDFQATEPGDSFLTLDQLSYEVLSHVGNYYSFYYHFIQNPSNLKFEIRYENTEEDYQLYTNTDATSINTYKSMGKYLYVTGDALYVDSNIDPFPKTISSQLENSNPYNNSNYYMVVAVDTSYPSQDDYALASAEYERMRLLFMAGIVSLIIGLSGCAATLYSMVCLWGQPGDESGQTSWGPFDLLPAEGCLLCFGAFTLCALLGARLIGYRLIRLFLPDSMWYYGELAIRILIFYSMGLMAAFSLLKRYKARTLWSGSFSCRLAQSLRRYFKDRRFTTRLAVFYSLFLLFNLGMTAALSILSLTYDSLISRIFVGTIALLCFLLDLWVFHQMYQNAWETDQINQALIKISHGDTAYKIDTGQFAGKERELAENINHISSGLETALQEKVRSERLKADLITNVSHDIKTPLTSIINYVDLIKRENIEDPRIQGYLEVLEQKSQRLKTLTEDLVEASKASSGNLKLEVTSIDFVELIWQTNGEFEEKFALRNLELVPNLPSEPLLIEADGRHLWRVLENLYNNTFKYAMEHSRVYADICQEGDKAAFTIKNISQKPLNIRPDELTERFVRGDVSRATEGSGLGLSIAKSLTELQGGTFLLSIDGDLFKAKVAFPLKK